MSEWQYPPYESDELQEFPRSDVERSKMLRRMMKSLTCSDALFGTAFKTAPFMGTSARRKIVEPSSNSKSSVIFNSRTYRAQLWRSPEHGVRANVLLVGNLLTELCDFPD